MHRRSVNWLVAVSVLVLLGGSGAAAQDGRAARTRPTSRPLPEPLDLGDDSAAPAEDDNGTEIAREARRAARWTARELVDRRGRMEYYRVGFHAALRAALDDPALGGWDFAEGERDGRRDPRAGEEGYELGRADAARAAESAAERQVAEQFHDLSVTPRPRPLADLPAYRPQPAAPAAPTLREVFSELPWISFEPLAPNSRYLSGWSYDAWRLYRCEDYREFYGTSWSDPAQALSFWLEDRRRSAAYRQLGTEAERELFRTLFRDELRHSLARSLASALRPAYDLGFSDGWSYGAFIVEEWNYRRGFEQGFAEASSAAAARAFDASYDRFYEASYRASFSAWSANPRPEIGGLAIRDGDDDGIFEPGESVRVEYELINYGGAGGRFGLTLDGSVLSAPGHAYVDLPRRQAVRQAGLDARISDLTPVRTRTSLQFSVGDLAEPVPIFVSRPLELSPGSLRTRRDNLNGQITVEIAVSNRSRRARGATVTLRADALSAPSVRRELKIVRPAESAAAVFDLSGFAPLDLISGAVTLELELESDGVPQDRLAHALPGTADDLGSRDLVEVLLRMARGESTGGSELATARELLMLRLRADWKAAARAGGNPYKQDLKSRGRRTALGDLVQTYRVEKRGLSRSEVFGGLSAEITELARELPGAHPLLRKYVRKLARQLP